MAREPYLVIATGQQGVGKSHQTRIELEDYVKQLHRPVVYFDTNDEYRDIKTIDFDITLSRPLKGSKKTEPNEKMIAQHVISFCEKVRTKQIQPQIRRIVPFTKNRDQMSNSQKLLTAQILLKNCRNCCLVLEDINTYLIGLKGVDTIGTFTNKRHRNQDIYVHVQSLAKLDPTMFENVNVIRMHHQPSKIKRLAYKANDIQLLQIAKAIVDREYHKNNNIYYFIYIKPQEGKLINCTPEQFELGCKDYISKNVNEALKPYITEIDLEGDGKTKKYSVPQAVQKFIDDHKYYLST